MNILLLLSAKKIYGSERFVLTLSKRLIALGHNCAVVNIFREVNNEFNSTLTSMGIKNYVFACKSMYDKSVIASLNRVIKEENYQIVHANGIKPDLYALILKQKTGVKILATCHNWIEKFNFFELLDKFVLHFFDHVAATSRKVKKILINHKVNQARITIVSNGVSFDDVKEFSDVQKANTRRNFGIKDEVLFSFVGRLSPEKGIINLINAFGEICRIPISVKLIIAGDGKLKRKCEDLVKTLNIEKNVIFIGDTNDVSLVYNISDIFVLPSYDEASPYALLEAMAHGKAVVTTAVGDVPEMVINNVSGLIVQPNIQSISAAMSILALDKTLRQVLGENAKLVVMEKYSDIIMANNYLKIYKGLITTNASN
ncbi:MAG: glycosyltransferase family 4 protein [Endomicrobiales bacterium]|nr:glycosyltransferase family 4 protein [Endomicrobiales bacterium]